MNANSVLDEISDPNVRRRQSQYRTLQLKTAALTSHQISADVEKIYEVCHFLRQKYNFSMICF